MERYNHSLLGGGKFSVLSKDAGQGSDSPLDWRWAEVGQRVHRGQWVSRACSPTGQYKDWGTQSLHQEHHSQVVTIGDKLEECMLWVGGWGQPLGVMQNEIGRK